MFVKKNKTTAKLLNSAICLIEVYERKVCLGNSKLNAGSEFRGNRTISALWHAIPRFLQASAMASSTRKLAGEVLMRNSSSNDSELKLDEIKFYLQFYFFYFRYNSAAIHRLRRVRRQSTEGFRYKKPDCLVVERVISMLKNSRSRTTQAKFKA